MKKVKLINYGENHYLEKYEKNAKKTMYQN